MFFSKKGGAILNIQQQLEILKNRLEELEYNKQNLQERNSESKNIGIINKQIKNIKRRIRELETSKSLTFNNAKFKEGKVLHNTKINMIQFVFDDTPEPEIIKHLQFSGFRRYKMKLVWQRFFNSQGVVATKWVLFKIKEIERKEVINVDMDLYGYIQHFDNVFDTNLLDTVKNKKFPLIDTAFQTLEDYIYAKNKNSKNKSEKMKVILKDIEAINDDRVSKIFDKYDKICVEIDFDTKKQLLTFGFCICLEQLKELNMIIKKE